MLVFVINKHGQALMPCQPRRARLLLKQNKAKIIKRQPFTIQLQYGSAGYTQDIHLGIDTGAKHIGVAITSENKVLAKGEITLRSDIKSLLDTRRIYRRSRRNRKTRYRSARFLNRTKNRKDGWLPPSLLSRVSSTRKWIDTYSSVLPNPQLHIEVGKFDVQKMINPTISGIDYQKGQTYSYHSERYFVFARDNYTCQLCKKQNKILNTHHIIYTSHGGTNRVDNLISLCTDCHTSENHKPGAILWQWMQNGKKLPSYREIPFMHAIRKHILKKYPDAHITYGSETTPHRMTLGLDKTHYNDAIAITGIQTIKTNPDVLFRIIQFRKKKRSLHEAVARKGRKTPNTTQKRNAKNTKSSKGFFLNDLVVFQGQVGAITGFSGSSSTYIKNSNGDYITDKTKLYKQVALAKCVLQRHQNNWQFIPHLAS